MNKTEIEQALDALQKISRRLQKKTAELASATNDAAEFEAEIEKIGLPHYKNEKAMLALALLERKLLSCQAAIARLETECQSVGANFSETIHQAGEAAADCLAKLYDRRIETISKVIAPFFNNEQGAIAAAKQTDAARAAGLRIQRLRSLKLGAAGRATENPAAALDILADVEAILIEALKKSPDLIQFFNFTPPPVQQSAPVRRVPAQSSAASTVQDAEEPATVSPAITDQAMDPRLSAES